jgi:thiamine biosynthesis lipoprotein
MTDEALFAAESATTTDEALFAAESATTTMVQGRYCRQEAVMGTVATVELADPVPSAEAELLLDEVFAWLRLVDDRFSTYKHDSEVNRLDRGEIDPAGGSADLRHVLDRCAELWQATDGYFDAYVAGRFDPSGYVKGWSVERACELLRAAGAVNHLVDVGGDIQTSGRPGPGRFWQIGIRHPFQPAAVCCVLAGTDLAIATSGTYERGLHVINPRTGGLAGELRSVTVVGRDLGQTDAYATAALAMGRSALTWLAGLEGYESLVIAADATLYRSERLPEAGQALAHLEVAEGFR